MLREVDFTFYIEKKKYPWWRFKKDETYIIFLIDGERLTTKNFFDYKFVVDNEMLLFETVYNENINSPFYKKRIFLESFKFVKINNKLSLDFTAHVKLFKSFGGECYSLIEDKYERNCRFHETFLKAIKAYKIEKEENNNDIKENNINEENEENYSSDYHWID